MNWSCEQIEARFSDYLDNTLTVEEQSALAAHIADCPRCAPLVAEVASLVNGIQALEQVPAPHQLVSSILDKTLGPRKPASRWDGVLAWVSGIASIRFGYGALSVGAVLIVYLAASGFSFRKPRVADLQPANIVRNADRQAHLVYARTTKFVSDLRIVYEIQSRLHQESEIPTTPENLAPTPEKNPNKTDGSHPASPKQQNRANSLREPVSVVAYVDTTFEVEAAGEPMPRRMP
jgi:anti-sigma factor RsiW